MPKNKKQRLNTAYQKHLDLLKALGIFLLAVSLIATGVISYLLAQEQYTEVLFYIFVAALIAFIAGILISIIASMKQNTLFRYCFFSIFRNHFSVCHCAASVQPISVIEISYYAAGRCERNYFFPQRYMVLWKSLLFRR